VVRSTPDRDRARHCSVDLCFIPLVVERMLAAATTGLHADLARAGGRSSRVLSRPFHHDRRHHGAGGLWLGDTENKTDVIALMADLVARESTGSQGALRHQQARGPGRGHQKVLSLGGQGSGRGTSPWPTRWRPSTHTPPHRCAIRSTTCSPSDVLFSPARGPSINCTESTISIARRCSGTTPACHTRKLDQPAA
jgi:hypothetical protein